MEDVDLVETFQPLETLNSHIPDSSFFNKLFDVFVSLDVLTEVTSLQEFCYQTERGRNLIIKGIHVANNIRVVDARKDSDFVKAVDNLLFRERLNFDPLEGIKLGISSSFNFVDGSKGSFSEF